jgi:hypothetical protein
VDMGKQVVKVNGTSSGSSLMEGFCISSVEPLGSVSLGSIHHKAYNFK